MTWLTRFYRNAFYGLEINGNPIVHIGDLIFEICARAVGHVIRTQGTPAWTKGKPSSSRQRHTNLFKYGYICRMCRTLHFRWKGQCATEIQFLNTPHDWRNCRQPMTPLWCSSIDTLWFRKKWHAHFRNRGWGRQLYLPPRLCGDMATRTKIALDSSFDLLLISRILVDNDENCQHHVINGINHG